ncbi:MAG TPA: hypothetical protein VFO16_09355, partial [Pseudonocardiaceae bacterium]|nr:hypothetical protein [Pseudonocardiaceae bacterium]
TLSDEEDAFIRNERVMGKISWRYWAERYATISLAAQAIGPMFPLWESQTLLLDRIGDLEWARYEEQHPDGVVVDILKDRQVGASTMAASFLAHRITTHPNVNALSASDVPESSTNVWDMLERIVDHLPWWMRPQILERTKNDEMVFSLGSRVLMGASKSTRGRDKTTRTAESAKGQLGRGRTLSCVHLSELATWTNPDQIDTALEPGIPVSPQTVWLKESTAQGKGPHNWWYQDWQLAKSGRGRSVAVFIPWYLERRRHWLPCPAGWVPAEETLAHARRIEESSPRWCRGRTYRPVREQLYWYEQAKAIAVTKDALEDFLAEHPADDEEAFQFSGKSVFSSLVRDRIRLQARPLAGMVTIKSNRELGTLP